MAYLTGILSLIVGVAGTSMSAEASKEAGKEGQKQKEYEANVLEEQATNAVGEGQREMLNERRRKEMVISRATALAAFGGGSVSDVTVQNIVADIDNEGSYREAVALYQGEYKGRQLNESARLSRMEGQLARKGGNLQARAQVVQGTSNALGQVSSLYTKYSQNNTPASTTLASGTGANS
jgi:hypothetical protein